MTASTTDGTTLLSSEQCHQYNNYISSLSSTYSPTSNYKLSSSIYESIHQSNHSKQTIKDFTTLQKQNKNVGSGNVQIKRSSRCVSRAITETSFRPLMVSVSFSFCTTISLALFTSRQNQIQDSTYFLFDSKLKSDFIQSEDSVSDSRLSVGSEICTKKIHIKIADKQNDLVDLKLSDSDQQIHAVVI